MITSKRKKKSLTGVSMYIGGETGCITCGQNAQQLKAEVSTEEWLSQDQVKELCSPCFDNMVKNNISRIKKSHFLEKFEKGNKMKFYEITYKGPSNTKFNLGGHTMLPNSILYFGIDELPITETHLKELPNITYNIVERNAKPAKVETNLKIAIAEGQVGVKWVGASPARHNDFGKFPKNEIVFVTHDVANKLKAIGGFEIINA